MLQRPSLLRARHRVHCDRLEFDRNYTAADDVTAFCTRSSLSGFAVHKSPVHAARRWVQGAE